MSPSQAAKLARLAVGESLPKSLLSKTVLAPLQEAHAVRLEQSGSSYVVRGIPGKLARFVEHHWGIRDLTQFAEATPENRNRAMLTDLAGDSKALPTRPFDGIFVRSFGGCYLRDQPLGTTPPGSAVLVTLSELPHLRVETKYLIGIENVECLWKFEEARRHFPLLDGAEFTLVLRWHWGAAWKQWLTAWQGHFLYFPDYDPSGLSVFATAVLPNRQDAHLLIPKDFDAILESRGKRPPYVKQERFLPTTCEHAEVAQVCLLLRRVRKALEQEDLLSGVS
ncbi:MAG: hypothetical protein ABSA47_10335 [Verrucomicrobiota bacterium]